MKVINRTLAPKHIPGCKPEVLLPGQEGEISEDVLKANRKLADRLAGDVAAGELEEAGTEKRPQPRPASGGKQP